MAPADTATQPQDVETTPPETEAPENDQESHSPEDLSEKYRSLRKGFDDKSKELKSLRTENDTLKQRLERVERKFRDDDEEPDPSKDQDTPVTKSDLDVLRFETANAQRIGLATEEYSQYRSEGLAPERALKLALVDKGITDDKSLAEHLRQQKASSAPSATDRSGDPEDVSPDVQERMKRFNYSKETYLKYRNQVEGRR